MINVLGFGREMQFLFIKSQLCMESTTILKKWLQFAQSSTEDLSQDIFNKLLKLNGYVGIKLNVSSLVTFIENFTNKKKLNLPDHIC